MSQHYPKPDEVAIPMKFWPSAYGVKRIKKIIEKDGLIVPILVRVDSEGFVAADLWQAERVLACREIGFETLLVETDWTEEDL
jgi:hypothetical protein